MWKWLLKNMYKNEMDKNGAALYDVLYRCYVKTEECIFSPENQKKKIYKIKDKSTENKIKEN